MVIAGAAKLSGLTTNSIVYKYSELFGGFAQTHGNPKTCRSCVVDKGLLLLESLLTCSTTITRLMDDFDNQYGTIKRLT